MKMKEKKRKKKHIVVSRQNNRSGNVGIFEADLPRLVVGSDLRCCARAVPTSVKVGRAHLSIELWGEFVFFSSVCSSFFYL